MVALISVAVLAVLGLLWWWVMHPHGRSHAAARTVELPLFSTRTPGRGVRIVGPSLSAPTPAPPAASEMEREAEAPRPAEPDPAHTEERIFTTGPRVVPMAPPTPPARNGSAAVPSANGASASGAQGTRRAEGSRVHAAKATRDAPSRLAGSVADPTVADGSALDDGADAEAARWGPPAETLPGQTVQFLPGRLEVLQGRALEGQEIRFIRPDRAGDRAVVTFGRGEGAPYRHVQLKVPTVSRMHARMVLQPGADSWTLENLSTTNPVAVNGVDLPEGMPPRPLADGDRVEMGEVVFIFRAR